MRRLYAAIVLLVIGYWLGACSAYELARRVRDRAMDAAAGDWVEAVRP